MNFRKHIPDDVRKSVAQAIADRILGDMAAWERCTQVADAAIKATLEAWPSVIVQQPYRDEVLGPFDGYIRLPIPNTEVE
jgi:hypothetical protein